MTGWLVKGEGYRIACLGCENVGLEAHSMRHDALILMKEREKELNRPFWAILTTQGTLREPLNILKMRWNGKHTHLLLFV